MELESTNRGGVEERSENEIRPRRDDEGLKFCREALRQHEAYRIVVISNGASQP